MTTALRPIGRSLVRNSVVLLAAVVGALTTFTDAAVFTSDADGRTLSLHRLDGFSSLLCDAWREF